MGAGVGWSFIPPDGRFLMNVSADEGVTSSITIVQNWTAGLKK
jgi:hypothetical protein